MKYITLISLFLVCVLSCKKKDNCKEELISAKQFDTDYGCTDTKHTLVVDLINNVTVIRSKESYDSKVTGPCHPVIDFNAYDLVIGKQSSANLNDTIIYDYRRACPGNELTLTVDIVQSAVTMPDNVTYHLLIPKVGDEENLNIKINIR